MHLLQYYQQHWHCCYCQQFIGTCLHQFTHLPCSHSCRLCQCYCAMMLWFPLPCIDMLCSCCLHPLFTVAAIAIALAIHCCHCPCHHCPYCHFPYCHCPYGRCPCPCFTIVIAIDTLALSLAVIVAVTVLSLAIAVTVIALSLAIAIIALAIAASCLLPFQTFNYILLLIYYCRGGGCHQLLDDCCCHFCLCFL